jgi:PAS domain S-box-containing protein
VFEQSPVPTWVVDGTTLRFLAVNDAAVRDSGYSRSELLGLTATTLCSSEDLAVILTEAPELAGQPRARIGRLRRKDGGFLEVHQTWSPLRLEGKSAWLVLLTAPMGLDQPTAVPQWPSPGLTPALPELTSNLVDAQRVLQATLDRSRANERQLRAQLQSRDVHLRTIQHRTKTTLQLAASLFNLQRAQHQDFRLNALFAASAQRLHVLVLLHEALEQTSPASGIYGAAYLQALRAAVIRHYQVDTQRILLTTDFDAVVLPAAHAMPCGLIMNELLTNAVTHAFPENYRGTVTMALRDTLDGAVMLRVADTGIGVPKDLNIHSPRTLGWQLVTLLTKQLHGSVELERGRGSRITVRLPR